MIFDAVAGSVLIAAYLVLLWVIVELLDDM